LGDLQALVAPASLPDDGGSKGDSQDAAATVSASMHGLRQAAAAVQKCTEEDSEAGQAAATVVSTASEAEGDMQAVFVAWSQRYHSLEVYTTLPPCLQ